MTPLTLIVAKFCYNDRSAWWRFWLFRADHETMFDSVSQLTYHRVKKLADATKAKMIVL